MKDNKLPEKRGLEALEKFLQAQDSNGIKLFDLVINEQSSDNDLKDLVTHRSLLSLIFYSIDHQKRIRAMANSTKSNEESIKARLKAQSILRAWLDKNIGNHKGKLDLCADHAKKELPNLGRGIDWIREEITAYRRSKKS